MGIASGLARRLNWRRRGWSTDQDRAFHDAVFTGQSHDPFTPSYPGNLTIRRFADLAIAHARDAESVFDLGCGPGEITCEMARRLPKSSVVGIDHSLEAVNRGQQLAARLGLTNVRFEQRDLERYELPEAVGLVTMFDAFHHVLDPAAFVARIGQSCDRLFLIEPAGNRLGQWQRTLDLDWLAESLWTIRDRLEYQFSLRPEPGRGPAPAPPAGEPTEHRYSLDDFSRWFAGYGLDVRGTIAGLERYGTAPHATSALRDDVGEGLFRLVAHLDEALKRAGVDLAAKHWAIYAERGASFPARNVPALETRAVDQPLAGPYDVEYGSFAGPDEIRAGSVFSGAVRLVNRSWRVWDSQGEQPVFLSYHWIGPKGEIVIQDGLRTPLARPLHPGESLVGAVTVQCPDQPGRYTLVVDLVHEGVTWFSRAGAPPLSVAVRVV